jgi:hypothetical protein
MMKGQLKEVRSLHFFRNCQAEVGRVYAGEKAYICVPRMNFPKKHAFNYPSNYQLWVNTAMKQVKHLRNYYRIITVLLPSTLYVKFIKLLFKIGRRRDWNQIGYLRIAFISSTLSTLSKSKTKSSGIPFTEI